jgi:isochorismate synthase
VTTEAPAARVTPLATAGQAGPEDALVMAVAEAANSGRPTLASVVSPLEARHPVDLYAAAVGLGLDAVLLVQPSHRFGLVGLGEAWSVEASGPRRFEIVDRAWRTLLDGAVLPPEPMPRATGPLLLGGFAFSDGAAITDAWRGFEAARLVLPELLVTTSPGGTWLTASRVAHSPEPADRSVATHDRWEALVAAPARDRGAEAAPGPLKLVGSRPEAAGWRDSVARLAGAVGRGRLDKAVLARQVEVAAAGPIDVPGVLHRLCLTAPESSVFAVSRGGRTFVGATPERLVTCRGREVRTVAMAGSTRRGTDPTADAMLAADLLASDKEREEHAVVVEMLRETLTPLTDGLEIPAQPAVLRLRHLQHLVTPVAGRLHEPLSIIRLAELLHPTPAVAGSPRELALELIADEEPFERGWFAGPLGWIDRSGDGELVVALRSGIVADRSALLMAGCGIVADSEPDREWQESEAKLQALGSALGGLEP